MYQICTRCVMDNVSDNTISFNKIGQCNYCCDIEKRKPLEYFSDDGENKLNRLIKEIKSNCKADKYDCMVGISGGLDSSYILYLGYRYNLRMLAVHVDDGLDNPVAVENINKLVEKTGADYVTIEPKRDEYADVIYSLLRASVRNLAIGQDNLIIKSLQEYGEKNNIKYVLDGNNFAHECILERSKGAVNSCDSKFIKDVHNKFGRIPLNSLKFMSLTERYIGLKANKDFKHIRPLNYIRYDMERAIHELEEFSRFEYYGGKHYESILTRFMQCYYLPEKFKVDKRKSHYSSLIMSDQMTRHQAIEKLKEPLYNDSDLLNKDKEYLAAYMDISVDELNEMIALPPKNETDYNHSLLNNIAPVARRFRRIIE